MEEKTYPFEGRLGKYLLAGHEKEEQIAILGFMNGKSFLFKGRFLLCEKVLGRGDI